MKSCFGRLLAYAPLGIAVLGSGMGCAEGSKSELTVDHLPSPPVERAEDHEGETIKTPSPSKPSDPPDEKSNETEDAGSGGPDTGASDSGASDSGASDSGASDSGAPTCASSNACASSTDLGSISGDLGETDVKTMKGSTSQWFKVRVTEERHAGDPYAWFSLKMRATLVSPPGTNFDLFVYVPASDTIECSRSSGQSTSTSSMDSTEVRFGEDGEDNGRSDDRTVTIEVRHVSGACDPSAKWTLQIEGA